MHPFDVLEHAVSSQATCRLLHEALSDCNLGLCRTAAAVQVLIRWALQRGTSCLPKSANPGRIAANFDVLDWQLQPEDQQALDTLPYRVSKATIWLAASVIQACGHAIIVASLTAQLVCACQLTCKQRSQNVGRNMLVRCRPLAVMPRVLTVASCLPDAPAAVGLLQQRMVSGVMWLSPKGPYNTLQDLWDEEE
jgi:hypothetical protein